MKWKFGWLSQVQIGLLLPMVMACIRNRPRHEPKPIDKASSLIGPSCIKQPNESTTNGSQLHHPLLKQLPERYQNQKDVAYLLKDINCNECLISNVAPPADQDAHNDFSACIEASLAIIDHDGKSQPNALPNTLCIVRNQKDGTWDKRILVGTASIAIRSNPLLPNSGKEFFSLIGFLVDIPTSIRSNHLVTYVKSGKGWNYYDNDGTKIPLSTEEEEQAMRLASENGTIFLYRKTT